MTDANGSSLRLAARLQSLDDDALARLIDARGIRSNGISDYFDLADALLDENAIEDALARLDRPTLATIAAASELSAATSQQVATRMIALGAATAATTDTAIAARLAQSVELGLAEPADAGAVSVYARVSEVLAGWPSRGLPTLDALVSEPAPTALGIVAHGDPRFVDRGASERAFAATTAVTELIAELQRDPARLLARGGIALPDLRRLAVATATELDEVASIISIAEHARLTAAGDAHWLPTTAAHEWLAGSASERWGVLAGAWLARLPADIRNLLAGRARVAWGDQLTSYVEWLFPAGGDMMRERVERFTHHAEILGITARQFPTSPGTALLSGDRDTAVALMHELFPTEVDRVYVQHDLSIVATGPLAARIDERLRTIADVEGRGLASHYRVTPSSITRALASGETEEEIRAFLSGISLSGIPQPLDYVITETVARHGSIRVGTVQDDAELVGAIAGARSYVRCDVAHVLGTLLVDHALSPLGLTRVDSGRLVSRFDRDVVFRALADARYPAAAEDADRHLEHVDRHIAIDPPASTTESNGKALTRRLRDIATTSGPDSGTWIARQLELAIRGKFAVRVLVALPDGSTASYLLEPTSIAAGRMRARDRRADLERTLPLASITGIVPLA